MKLEQAARQALEALVKANHFHDYEDEITALREALAEQADMNLNCKSVQARLATSWGYVKAEQAEQEPIEYLMEVTCSKCGTTESGVLKFNTPQTVSQELPAPERQITKPKQGTCECVVKQILFSGDREYCETCGWPIYTFDEHLAKLLEKQK